MKNTLDGLMADWILQKKRSVNLKTQKRKQTGRIGRGNGISGQVVQVAAVRHGIRLWLMLTSLYKM